MNNERRLEKKKFYNTKQWKVIRQDILIEQPFCYMCKKQPTNHIDHCVPFTDKSDPLSIEPTNLYGLCHSCHSIVTTDKEYKYIDWYNKGVSMEEIAKDKYKSRRIGLDGYPL